MRCWGPEFELHYDTTSSLVDSTPSAAMDPLELYPHCTVEAGRGGGRLRCEMFGVPIDVPAVRDPGAIASAAWSTCVAHGSGSVSCWDIRYSSDAGDLDELRAVPPVRALVDGFEHQCALLRDGGFACWSPDGLDFSLEPAPAFGPTRVQLTPLAVRSHTRELRSPATRATPRR